MMTYDKRNLDNLEKLADHTKIAAKKWYAELKKEGIDILIYSTIRTIEEQRANVKNGVSQTMKSYHIVGQALDFVLIDKDGNALWNGYDSANAKKVISIAKKYGFFWGGDWVSFKDQPHLQYNYLGYGEDTFGKYKEEVKPVVKPKDEPKKETPATKPVDKPKVESKPAQSKLTYTRLLKLGSEGEDVKQLQKALNKLNFKCGKEDGDFGKLVKDAVTRLQKVHLPYEIDGMAGKNVVAKINKLLK